MNDLNVFMAETHLPEKLRSDLRHYFRNKKDAAEGHHVSATLAIPRGGMGPGGGRGLEGPCLSRSWRLRFVLRANCVRVCF